MNVTLFLPLAISTFLFIIISISSASTDTPLTYTNGQQAQQLGKLNGSIDDEGKKSLDEKVNEKNVSKLHNVSKIGGGGRGGGGRRAGGGRGSRRRAGGGMWGGGRTWIVEDSGGRDCRNSVSRFWILLLIIFVSFGYIDGVNCEALNNGNCKTNNHRLE
nr:uncharacterized protein LOC112712734 [Arachis hypogaea]